MSNQDTGYRCEASTLEGFIQQLAVSYVGRGYWHYVTGNIAESKDPRHVDQKLIERYNITSKKWERAHRKRQGLANLQYIRFERFFVLLATDGKHTFKDREASQIRDARRNAIRFGGYQVSFRNGHVQVRIDDETYQLLKSYYVDLAVRRNLAFMVEQFYRFPFEPYAPIRRQAFNILREINRVRRQMGYQPVPTSSIWLKRRIVKPFEPVAPLTSQT